jgi:hypothetical protein
MKHFVIHSLLVLSLTTSAFAESKAEVLCRNTSGLPSGLSVSIFSQEGSDGLVAELINRDNLGPFVDLGDIAVTRVEYPNNVRGGPVTFIGYDFRLDIIWDGGLHEGGYPSYVDVTIQGRHFSEPMRCELHD